ncbi:site-specific DNA-methyltransferase [Sphingorhabdus sp.]|uniref:site-specific DNA-methyltransferase n=1 Tax=Sphingorhabdus sp. TaxID=1902408 RepID=UPI0035935426
MTQPAKMDLTSMDVAAQKREELKQSLGMAFPEVFAEGSIDFDQLKRVLGEWVDPSKERFGLNWAGKAECMKVIQQPSVATLKPMREESVNFDDTDNLFIEGDNLEVLKLLQKAYFGKVKMIYIDPPYNTGNEFIYPDKYSESLETYLSYTGQVDSGGKKFSTNSELSGRFHSNWVNMMYPRLYLAKNLLCDDGVIFMSIDDNELDSARAILKEIFGEEMFISQIIIQSNKRGQTYKEIAKTHEYLLMFSKGDDYTVFELEKHGDALPFKDSIGAYDLWELRNRNPKFGRHNRPNLFYPIYVAPALLDESGYARISLTSSPEFNVEILPRNSEGADSCWRWGKDKVSGSGLGTACPSAVAKQRRDGHWNIYERSRKSTTKAKSLWTDTDVISEQGTVELGQLGLANIFDHPKPIGLIEKCLKIGTTDEDIVLDFFAGSCTTAHSVMRLNKADGGKRRFITVQLPEPCDEETAAAKAGFRTIAAVGRERIRRAAKSLVDDDAGKLNLQSSATLDLGVKSFRLDRSAFALWNGASEAFDEAGTQLDLHVDHINEAAKPEDVLYELLLKAGFELTTKVETISMADSIVFAIHDGALLICLEKDITPELIDALAEANPLQVICLDEGFKGNDQLKANAVQTFKARAQAEESEIVFRTV